MADPNHALQHPQIARRTAIQAGAVGLLGLGMNHVQALRAQGANGELASSEKSVIYIFLSGGLAQQDSFDMKPDAPDDMRGEFNPIDTKTPGLRICEHLPMLAQRSDLWALCRSVTHGCNDHSLGHHIMLTGRSDAPRGFSGSKPQDTDWPSIAAIANAATEPRGNLPRSVVLPEKLVHNSGRVIPGQFAGIMGEHRNPWFIEASPYHTTSYGAFPEYQFDHQQRGNEDKRVFRAPNLQLPHGLTDPRFKSRIHLSNQLSEQRQRLEQAAATQQFDRFRQGVVSLLTDRAVQQALDVTNADERIQERYGKNSFGWSLLMAKRLVESGVNLVQVNLGNDETWDTLRQHLPTPKRQVVPADGSRCLCFARRSERIRHAG